MNAGFKRFQTLYPNGSIRAQILLGALTAVLLGPWAFANIAQAQWHTLTPRDTVKVAANQVKTVSSKMQLNNNLWLQLNVSGTYGTFPGQSATGFDGRYTYDVPNWNAPFPLLNPPSFGARSYQIYTTINITGLKEDSLKVLETSYQQNHHYTARYQSAGVPVQFRIKDRLDERPDGYYYSQATGGLTIALAQYTAGISVQKSLLEFGLTNIGFSANLLDSIGSYGIDPLTIDSMWLDGPNAANFSLLSQRGNKLSLPNESTNEFKLFFTPSMSGDNYGYLHIHSVNADGPNRIKTITLHGTGTTPKLAIGPKVIDFGRVRVGYPLTQTINIFNGGNATLYITSARQVNGPNTAAGIFLPSQNIQNITGATPKQVYANSNWPLGISFNPVAMQKYSAMIYFQGTGVPPDSVLLIGEGAEPVFQRKDTTLDFGTVRSFDQSVRTTLVRNVGNWTANVIDVQVTGPNPTAFIVTPDLNPFLLNSDSSRTYSITFQPRTKSDGPRNATLKFSFDNGAPSQSIVLSGYEVKPRISYDTNIVDFGKVRVFATGHHPFAVNNSGNVSIAFDTNWKASDPTWHTFDLKNKPGSLLPGISSLDLTFRPHQPGPANNWIYFNAGGQVDSIYMFGIGAVPKAWFSPSVVDFGIVQTGQQNNTSVILKDSGDYPLYPIGARITGPDASMFSWNWDPRHTLPDTILEGGIDYARIGVSFKTNERSGRKYNARLEVLYADNFFDTVSLVATEAAQFIQFGSNRLDFGKVHVGSQAKLPAKFINGAAVTLSIGNIWTTPTGGPFFEGQPATSVDPGKYSEVQVMFGPTAKGAFTGYLHAKDGDIKEDSIPLTGVGAQAVPQFSTKLVDFGTITLTKSSAKSVTLTNAGDWPLTAKVIKTKDGNNEFAILGPSSQVVDPVATDSAGEGQTRTYSVTFTPKSPQQVHEADLIFEFDDGTQQTVILTGKDEENYLAVDSSNVDFGKVRIGSGPATRFLHLINNSASDLQAQNIQIIGSVPSPTPFGATPNGMVPVSSRTVAPITVKFQPTQMGLAQAMLVGEGNAFEHSAPDTVMLTGIGAQPIPTLSTSLIDFGLLPPGNPSTQSFTLKNSGNWPLNVRSWSVSGPNAADFTPVIPQDTTISEGEAKAFDVSFVATTPLQATPRTATIIFVQDDGSLFTLPLVANDKAPLGTPIGFVNYLARPGDQFVAYLKLRTAIPATLNITEVKGSVSFDPTLVTLEKVEAGALVATSAWSTSFSNMLPGSFDYDILSTQTALSVPGNLLKLTFRMHSNVPLGGRSVLANLSNYPTTKEATAQSFNGLILVDSGCGPHVTSGVASATFIDQNMPNPVAPRSSTSFPFDVGKDNTVVTLRIMDMTGKEILKVLDNVSFNQGRYQIPVDAGKLTGDGVYFYEFVADGGTPQIKKMMVR